MPMLTVEPYASPAERIIGNLADRPPSFIHPIIRYSVSKLAPNDRKTRIYIPTHNPKHPILQPDAP